MILQIFVVLIILYCGLLRWKARHLLRFGNMYKCDIESKPIIGHSYFFAQCKNDVDRWKVLEMFGREALKQGGAIASWNLHRLFFVIADPVIAESVMKSCLEKDDAMKLTLNLVGNGSAVAEVPIWRPRRKILVPTFSKKNLLQFQDVFVRQSQILMEQLEKIADDGKFSLSEYIMKYAMDSVCETTLGTVVNAQHSSDQRILKAFISCCKIMSDRITRPWLHSDLIYKLTSDYREFMLHENIIRTFIDNVIDDKRKELKERNNIKKQNEKKEEENQFKPFLELMIESSGGDKGYNNTELREEIITLFTAGTDTSTLASSFTSVLLARHPDIQEKVYEEMKEVFGTSSRAITTEDLNQLKYLEAVIKETLRLYPPAPTLLRKADEDVMLPSGVKLPKNTGIVLSLFVTHRNPKYWGDDAEEFRPERFLDEAVGHPAAYLTFSYGPRNCLGYKYAMMSMKTVLTTLLRKFRVLPVSELDIGQPLNLKYDIMLRAADDFQVILETRKNV